jgi:hypothetical protein
MESLVAFLVLVLVIIFCLVVRSPANRQARAAANALARVGSAWDCASADLRNRLLKEAGFDSASGNSLVVRPWAQLNISVQSKIALQSELVENFFEGSSFSATEAHAEGGADKQITSETGRNSYFDGFFGLSKSLSRSIPLHEWATGIPQRYSTEEAQSIEAVRQARSKLQYTTASRFVEEPLQKLLSEIGLMNWATEDRANCYDEWGPDMPPESMGSITSALLKAWICGSNPFVLLELAEFLIETGHISEAREAAGVASEFPAFAKDKSMNDMESVAQLLAFELFPAGPSREARAFGQGLYSSQAITLLHQEIVRIQIKLNEHEAETSLFAEDDGEEMGSDEVKSHLLTIPDEDRMKRIWDAWEKNGEEGIRDFLENEKPISPPNSETRAPGEQNF